jgi:hypothetical protein
MKSATAGIGVLTAEARLGYNMGHFTSSAGILHSLPVSRSTSTCNSRADSGQETQENCRNFEIVPNSR